MCTVCSVYSQTGSFHCLVMSCHPASFLCRRSYTDSYQTLLVMAVRERPCPLSLSALSAPMRVPPALRRVMPHPLVPRYLSLSRRLPLLVRSQRGQRYLLCKIHKQVLSTYPQPQFQPLLPSLPPCLKLALWLNLSLSKSFLHPVTVLKSRSIQQPRANLRYNSHQLWWQ